ncbi:hypothetical protein [Sulfitobacter sp.]|uniref:hypothetical protein n=1 Tax=Sulfitobacter sp. TaxID=1903071 RepID=UPI003EF9C160
MITALVFIGFASSAAWGQVGGLRYEEDCIPYINFLDANKPATDVIQNADNCDEYQRLILGSKDWAGFLRDFTKRASKVHYQIQLQYAFEARVEGNKASAIERLDRALYGSAVVFRMIDDPDRSILYTSLVTWERNRTLTELGDLDEETSAIYENYPYAHEKMSENWPDDPETALICLIMADDLFIDLYKLLKSRLVSECLSK